MRIARCICISFYSQTDSYFSPAFSLFSLTRSLIQSVYILSFIFLPYQLLSLASFHFFLIDTVAFAAVGAVAALLQLPRSMCSSTGT